MAGTFVARQGTSLASISGWTCRAIGSASFVDGGSRPAAPREGGNHAICSSFVRSHDGLRAAHSGRIRWGARCAGGAPSANAGAIVAHVWWIVGLLWLYVDYRWKNTGGTGS